ncbi:MAG: Uma2 family endonuclease [Acidobacteriia bacterium]|nr:Uma2 family endonuclease [Terriglobia bacterium]
MATQTETLVSLEEYLSTSYSPDREYKDGVLVERNVGDWAHARLQAALTAYFWNRRKQWNIEVCTELRVRVKENWYPLPDICIYQLPVPQERYPQRPPLLWIEILSADDSMPEVWAKAKELVKNGVPYVWIVEPNELDSELWTVDGLAPVPDRTLRLPGTEIVIPLPEVMQE